MGGGASSALSPKAEMIKKQSTRSLKYLPPDELLAVHNSHVTLADDEGHAWQGGDCASPSSIKKSMAEMSARGSTNLELFNMLVKNEHTEDSIREGATSSNRALTVEDLSRESIRRRQTGGVTRGRLHRCNSSLIPSAHQTKTIQSRTTIQYRCVDRTRLGSSRSVANGAAEQKAIIHEVDAEVLSLISSAMLRFFYACSGLFEILHQLVEEATEISLAAGQTLLSQGDEGNKMYVLQTGELKLVKDEVDLGKITPGQSVGELCLIFHNKNEHTVIATEPSVVWAITRESFQTLQADHAFQTTNATTQAIQGSGCFKSLSLYSQRMVASSMSKAGFEKDDCLLTEGEETDVCLLVEEGTVEVTSAALDADAILARFPEGASIGHIWKDGDTIKAGPGMFLGSLVLLAAAEQEGGDVWLADKKKAVSSITIVAENHVGVSQLPLEALQDMLGRPIAEALSEGADHHFGSRSGARALPPVADLTIADFQCDSFLGEGGFGRVLHATCVKDGCRLHGKQYAVKIMDKNAVVAKGETEHVRAERRMLEILHHPLVLGLEASFQDEHRLFLVTPYVRSVSMFDCLYEPHVQPPEENKNMIVRHWAANIIEAMAHIHAQGIAYRDLKPENLLVDESGRVVIIDMGFAKAIPWDEANDKGELVHHGESFTLCGTFEYLAPEFFFDGHKHTHAVDLWAMGVLFFEFIAGKTPFVDEVGEDDYKKIFTRICKTKFKPFVVPQSFDDTTSIGDDEHRPAYRQMLQGLLTADTHQRLGHSAGGTFAIKHHAYFDGFDWGALECPPWAPAARCFAESLRPMDECPEALEVLDPFNGPSDAFINW